MLAVRRRVHHHNSAVALSLSLGRWVSKRRSTIAREDERKREVETFCASVYFWPKIPSERVSGSDEQVVRFREGDHHHNTMSATNESVTQERQQQQQRRRQEKKKKAGEAVNESVMMMQLTLSEKRESCRRRRLSRCASRCLSPFLRRRSVNEREHVCDC